MIPIQHDISLVIGSTLFAFVAGYFLMPIQKIWWRESRRKFATLMLFAGAVDLVDPFHWDDSNSFKSCLSF